MKVTSRQLALLLRLLLIGLGRVFQLLHIRPATVRA